MTGTWAYGDRKGTETWTRVDPGITSVRAVSEIDDAIEIDYPVLKVVSKYEDTPGTSRGNLPRFYVTFTGDSLWGLHYAWLPPSSGLEIVAGRYICVTADGSLARSAVRNECMRVSKDITQYELEIMVTSRARPGTYNLLFDGREVPIELTLPTYVDPTAAILDVQSCSVIRERAPGRNPPLLFTRYDPNPPPTPAQ